MGDLYEPEMGQMFFGQPYKEFGVPEIWEAALRAISEELERLAWNLRQDNNWYNPFGNTSGQFVCEVFAVEAYSWGDDEQPFNFKWRDVEISWYKYLGRGMSSNQKLTADLASQCLDECLAFLRADEAKREERRQ